MPTLPQGAVPPGVDSMAVSATGLLVTDPECRFRKVARALAPVSFRSGTLPGIPHMKKLLSRHAPEFLSHL
jgi:hypothetical protein